MAKRPHHQPQAQIDLGVLKPLIQKAASWITVGIATFVANVASSGVQHIQKLSDSVTELNRNVAVVIESISVHQRELDRHERELDLLKSRIENPKGKGIRND